MAGTSKFHSRDKYVLRKRFLSCICINMLEAADGEFVLKALCSISVLGCSGAFDVLL